MANTPPAQRALQKLMEQRGFTRNALAVTTGIPETTLRRRLTDGDFTVTQLRSIADALDLTPADILRAVTTTSAAA